MRLGALNSISLFIKLPEFQNWLGRSDNNNGRVVAFDPCNYPLKTFDTRGLRCKSYIPPNNFHKRTVKTKDDLDQHCKGYLPCDCRYDPDYNCKRQTMDRSAYKFQIICGSNLGSHPQGH